MRNRTIYFIKNPLQILIVPITRLPYFKFLRNTSDYQCYVNFLFWFKQKVLNIGGNKKAYWPVHFTSKIFDPQNILVGVDAYPGIMGGCYIQGMGKIEIGDYTQIAPNVAIISANHDLYDNREHILKKIVIGKYCWLGNGCTILPGVVLGDFTIVAAGAVVTKSFPDGYCVVGGVPAILIKKLEPNKCIKYKTKYSYNGYIKSENFEIYRSKKLNI